MRHPRRSKRNYLSHMERTLHLAAVCLLMIFNASAQNPADSTSARDPRPLKDRFWFGGGLGLNFGTVTAIQVEPMVGYYLDRKNKVSVGTGISYWYYSDPKNLVLGANGHYLEEH